MSQLDQAFERFTKSLSDGGRPEPIPQRTVRFRIPAKACAPGVFENDLWITIRSLTPEQEMRAARGCDGDPVRLALMMAQTSLWMYSDTEEDGEELSAGRREFLWRALDQAGRNLCVKRFGELGTVDAEDEGNSDDSVRLG